MFYISYYSNKDKKNIIRRGKIDKKFRLDTNTQGKPYFVYFDIDKNNYRCATGIWEVRAIL